MLEKFNNLSDSQKKMFKMFGIVIVVFVVIIILVSLLSNKKVSYSQLENVASRAAEQYVNANPDVIKDEVYGTTRIDFSTLISKKYMKEMSKYVGDEVSCKGEVLVYKNLDNYKYIPRVDCGEAYTSKSLFEILTDEKNIVTSGSGLYEQDENYFYRGEYVDNYVRFSNDLWRIISISPEGEIRLIQNGKGIYAPWDDRYNSDYGYSIGINKFEGVESSRIKNAIMEAYNDGKIILPESKGLIIPQKYCVGPRSENDEGYEVECELKSELMGASSLTVSDYLRASLSEDCNSINSNECLNYNYLASMNSSFWTVTPKKDDSGSAYYITASVQSSKTSNYKDVKLVVTVNGLINYTNGDGTINNPYIID